MKKLILIALMLITTPAFAQTFLDKKCEDLSKEIDNRQQAIVDQQAYVVELQNEYSECSDDKQSIEDAKTIVAQAQMELQVGAKQVSNWSDLNAISSPVVNP